jgi:hypothetical protein
VELSETTPAAGGIEDDIRVLSPQTDAQRAFQSQAHSPLTISLGGAHQQPSDSQRGWQQPTDSNPVATPQNSVGK